MTPWTAKLLGGPRHGESYTIDAPYPKVQIAWGIYLLRDKRDSGREAYYIWPDQDTAKDIDGIDDWVPTSPRL